MTYLDLIRDVVHKLEHNEITFGEYNELIEPLRREIGTMYTDEEIDRAQAVEQAYVDKMVELSVNDVLDKLRADIEHLSSELTVDGRRMVRREHIFQIIDKYKSESEIRND